MSIVKKVWSVIRYPMLWLAVLTGICFVYVTGSLISVGEFVVSDEVSAVIRAGADSMLFITSAWVLTFFMLHKEWRRKNFWRKGKVTSALIPLCIVLGVAMSVFFVAIFSMIDVVRESSEYISIVKGFTGGNIVLLILCRVLAGPFVQEVMFRGIILRDLSQKMRVMTAVIIQALLFAVIHVSFLQGIYALIGGIVIGLIFLWLDSLWAALAVHLAFNAALIGVLSINMSRPFLIAAAIGGLVVSVAAVYLIYNSAKRLFSAKIVLKGSTE